MAGSLSNRLLAITVASLFLLLCVAVSQASGARILGGGRRLEDASVTIGNGHLVLEENRIESSPLVEDCGEAGNKLIGNVLLLGFLTKGTVVPPSGPSKRSNGSNN